MIITRVKLNPFGGMMGRELRFRSGLNVIVGPNEAGKSTVFQAIFAALFVRSKLGKRDLENKIQRFLPLGGGDTIRVELDFAREGDIYKLKKTWGGTVAAELVLPDGTSITDEEEIEKRLTPLLGAAEGTYKSVLMTYQSGLGRTLESLSKDHPETIRNLGDILRAAVLETDGISIDRFRERVEAEYNDYFSRWDRKEDYPEKGKSIQNPWKKQVGKILQAFYDKEDLKAALEEVRRLEEELGRINQEIGEQAKSVKDTEVYLKKNQQAVEDARERRTLSAELNGLKARLKNYQEANNRWPVIESKLEELAKKMPVLEKRKKTFASERKTAEELEKNRALRQIYQRASAKKKVLEEAIRELQTLKRIKRENLEKLRAAISRIDRLQAGLAGGRLTVKLTAKKNMRVKLQKDIDMPAEKELKTGQALEIKAGGRVKIDHAGLSVEATSGDRPFEEISREYEAAKKLRDKILSDLDVAGITEAETDLRAREEQAGIVRQAEQNLKDELGNYTFENLKRQLGGQSPAEKVRPLAEVAVAHEKVKGDIRAFQEKQEQLKNQIEVYVKEYTDKQTLLLSLAEAVKKQQEIGDKITKLLPLPEGVEDPEIYIRDFQRRQAKLRDMQNKLSELKIKQAGLIAKMPEETEEALERRLLDAEDRFSALEREGDAVARIRDIAGPLLEEINRDTFKGLQKDVEGMIEKLTGKRYRSVAMEGSLPRGLVRADGQILTHDLLSVGTRDELALAIRLAMAKQFLGDSDGFLIMDDPLVDLDPERQQAAAELLSDFAAEKQLLIFTCHQSHAEHLKGEQVILTQRNQGHLDY